MVLGYFLYAGLILGKGLMGEVGAIASVPGNCFQAAVGIIAGVLLMYLLNERKAISALLKSILKPKKSKDK